VGARSDSEQRTAAARANLDRQTLTTCTGQVVGGEERTERTVCRMVKVFGYRLLSASQGSSLDGSGWQGSASGGHGRVPVVPRESR
jgi:hypothetical protein